MDSDLEGYVKFHLGANLIRSELEAFQSAWKCERLVDWLDGFNVIPFYLFLFVVEQLILSRCLITCRRLPLI